MAMRMLPKPLAALSCLMLALFIPHGAGAQEDELPYWAMIGVDEVNMRVGPSAEYRILWVYTREGLPVKVLRKKEGWRFVEDFEGTRGWMAARMLRRERAAIVTGDGVAPMRGEPRNDAPLFWNAEPGVVGMLGECENAWCRFEVDGRRAWIEQTRIWGAGAP
jgi:SH3-like domain-containing protein